MTTQNFTTVYALAARWGFPVLLILLFISLFTCNGEKARLNDQLKTNEASTRQIENERGQLVAVNNVLKAQNSDDIRALTDSLFNLKDRENKLIAAVTGYTKIVQGIKFTGKEAVYIPGTDTKETVYLPQPEDTTLIRVPRSFYFSDSTININGTVKRNSVSIDSVKIPNTVNIRTVKEKTGFLNLGRRDVVQVINTNPAFTSQVSTITLDQKPNAWNKWIKPVLSFAAGAFLAAKAK